MNANSFLFHTTTCESMAQAVANRAADAGLRIQMSRCERGGEGAWRIAVACSPAQLRKIVRQARERVSFGRAWAWALVVPSCPRAWAWHFARYVVNRYHDERSEGTTSDGLDVLRAVATFSEAAAFDLRDALTFSYWCDYLNEYPERRAAWRAFERAHGICDVL